MNPPPLPLPPADRLSSIVINPAPSSWGEAIQHWRGRSDSQPAVIAEFRRELGLPIDRPVIMTGHQAEFWHPGILAKYLAADAAGRRLDAGVAWVVVDQDSHPPASIRYPVREKGDSLAVRTWEALPGADVLVERNVPLCLTPAESPAALPKAVTFEPFVSRGMTAIYESLGAHSRSSSAAQQVAAAIGACLRDLVPLAPTIFASRLSSTRLFAWILDRMRSDPLRCAQAYNDAIAAHPEARLAPLRIEQDPELPLWVIGAKPGQPRARASASRIAETASLAPRALLMTALLRMAGGDLFIHGLGGGIYDKATERWMREWLGVELAPTAVATATLLLPIDEHAITPAEIDRAEWRAHHARHDPAMLGDPAAAQEKSRLLQQIRDRKRAGEDPSPAFAQLQQLLVRTRAAHDAGLAELSREAAAARSRRNDASIAHDRTWAFPLYPSEDLQHLKREIEARFA
jgi:hypothetical protein